MMNRRQGAAAELAWLVEQRADRFDPVRFRYIAELVRRSAGKPPAVMRRLEEKALDALAEYRTRLAADGRAAAGDAAGIDAKTPDATGRRRQGGDPRDFRGPRRIHRDQPSRLSALNDQVAALGRMAGEQAAQFCVDEILRRQEDAVIASLSERPQDGDAPPSPPAPRLRAYHFFAENRAGDHAAAVVAGAIRRVPEDPGHLNSQMLVTRCLCAMHRLAPAYLRRWVVAMETLLWLAQAGPDATARPAEPAPEA